MNKMYAQSSLLKFILNKKKGNKNNGKIMKGGGKWELGSLIKEKSGFLAAVFATLIFQLIVVFAIVKFIPKDDPVLKTLRQFLIGVVILQIALVFLIVAVPMPMPIKFVMFTVFSALTGFTIKLALQNVSQEIIQGAIVSTIAMFVVFLVIGLVVTGFGIDLGPLAFALFGLLLLLVIVSVVSLFMKTTSTFKKTIAVLTIMLFSVFIVFDTNQILQRDYEGDFVTASLDYFLDIINIFLSIVSYMNNE
jgi:FtsH-binding integral membrane protein